MFHLFSKGGLVSGFMFVFRGKITAPAVIVATGDTFLGVDVFFPEEWCVERSLVVC